MSKYKGMYIEYINNNKIYEKMYYIYHLLKEISYLFFIEYRKLYNYVNKNKVSIIIKKKYPTM